MSSIIPLLPLPLPPPPPPVLLVVSGSEADVMEAFAALYSMQKEAEQAKNSCKWLTPHLFYYHVLLHDVVGGNSARYETVYATAMHA